MKLTRLLTVLLAVALLAAACSSGDDVAGEASVVPDASDSEVSEPSESTPDDAGETVEVVAAAATEPAVTTTTTQPVAPEPVTASTVPETTTDDFPDILAVQATPDGDGTWRFDVTVSSTYDSPERYADGWRVVGPDGTEFGFRLLTHHHANEQPFTRSQSGIAIPADVTTVTIEGRDLANGFGGGFLEIDLG